MMRKILISIFVIAWIILFHYESLRAFYLSPALGRPLPKTPLLFPPAGWIMFYEIDNSWSTAEVYGLKKDRTRDWIDPHRIFATRFVGFDNIHRNIMVTVLDPRKKPSFCTYLKRKFPEYESFEIVHAGYPALIPKESRQKVSEIFYSC